MKDQLDALITQMLDRGVRLEDALRAFEKRFISHALERCHGNQSKAADFLGMHRNTLSRKMDAISANHRRSIRKRTR